jgi:hypothetical protein
MALITSAQDANSIAELEGIGRELLKILTEAVQDLDADRLSEESFNSFRTILQIGLDVTRDRRAIFIAAHPQVGISD